MIELIQFPWSPFCIVQRRILEYAGVPFKIRNILYGDRTAIWKLTRERYYAVPIVRDGRTVIFETDENSQVIAKYIDEKYQLDLFPRRWRGIQTLLWQHIEGSVEECTFKLNDIYWEEMVPPAGRLGFLRHKERKFGRGCLTQWRQQQKQLLQTLEERLEPYEQMLLHRSFLLEDQPRFVDFDLFGMLGNFLFSGHYRLPRSLTQLQRWYRRMETLKRSSREKLSS